jgi:hypothetical protein
MLSEHLNHDAANELLDAVDALECIDGAGGLARLPAHLDRLGDALRAAGRAYEIVAADAARAAGRRSDEARQAIDALWRTSDQR